MTTPLDSKKKRLVIKRFIQIVIYFILMAVILFTSSGRLDWTMAWIYLGLYLVLLTGNSFLLCRKNPELIAERAGVKEGTKSWDKILITIITATSVVLLFVAGFDQRYRWSSPVGIPLLTAAVFVVVMSSLLSSWAMVSNAFFSGTVRIQSEREHRVVREGPYRIIRHPGYSALILGNLALPLVLESYWAYIPSGIGIVSMIIRTSLEDRTLQNELSGYSEYALTTKYRLIPFVW